MLTSGVEARIVRTSSSEVQDAVSVRCGSLDQRRAAFFLPMLEVGVPVKTGRCAAEPR